MKTFSLIFRLLILPVMVVVFAMNACRWVLIWSVNYVRYGSEMIIFDEKMNRETVRGLLDKLTKDEKPQ